MSDYVYSVLIRFKLKARRLVTVALVTESSIFAGERIKKNRK